jgi:Cu+-exporting ATPase
MRGDPGLVPAALGIGGGPPCRSGKACSGPLRTTFSGFPLAAAGLPSPALAGAAMALSSVSVLASALLLAAGERRLPGRKAFPDGRETSSRE